MGDGFKLSKKCYAVSWGMLSYAEVAFSSLKEFALISSIILKYSLYCIVFMS